MFNFLKDKLKATISKFGATAEEKADEKDEILPLSAQDAGEPKEESLTEIGESKEPVEQEYSTPEMPNEEISQHISFNERIKKLFKAKEEKAAEKEEIPPDTGKCAEEESKETERYKESKEVKSSKEAKDKEPCPSAMIQEAALAKEGFFSSVFKRKKKEEQPQCIENRIEDKLETKAAEPQKIIEEQKPEKATAKKKKDDTTSGSIDADASLAVAGNVPDEEKIDVEDNVLEEEYEPVSGTAQKTDYAKPLEMPETLEIQRTEYKEESKGFFSKIKEKVSTKILSEKHFEDLFFELELVLMENNVAIEAIEKMKDDLKKSIVNKPIPRGQIENTIRNTLRNSISGMFKPTPDLVALAKTKKPYVICFVGVNGSGKTTTIAKVAKHLMDNGLSCVLAAADTFRAAAIDQLMLHGEKLGAKVIKHDYGSDAAAVAFDAIEHAKAKGKDVVLIDTAGRLHSNSNLMDELRKIVRVAKPDLKVFIGESVTGNDCIEQARQFNDTVGIDGIILTKSDVDEKGGAAISISYVTGKPIMYLGTGQEYADFEQFDKIRLLEQIGLA